MMIGRSRKQAIFSKYQEIHLLSVDIELVKVMNIKCKAIPVTGRGGLYGCNMLRIPHCLDNRLTDGGIVRSRTKGHGVCLFVCLRNIK
jgi:hypothetical protein